MSSSLWLTWETQRRNRSMASALGVPLVEMDLEGSRMQRYLHLVVATFRLLLNKKPETLFVQNPSLVLAFLAVFLKRIFSIKCVVLDAHNGGVFPLEGRSKALLVIARLICRHADAVIVTNNSVARYIEEIGGSPIIIPDPLPSLAIPEKPFIHKPNKSQIVTFVSTWASDEPCEEVISAAKQLPGDVKIYITGKAPDRFKEGLPSNVILTGFLCDTDYISLLNESDAVMVLTTRDDCLNCGAYEAVSLNKPMILADTPVLREYFSKGAVYTKLTSNAIRESVVLALDQQHKLSEDIVNLQEELSANWTNYAQNLAPYFQVKDMSH